MQSETIGKLSSALCKAQGEMENAKKDSSNPFFRSKYADLSSVIEAVKVPLSKNGLSYVQYVEKDQNKDSHYLYTQLMHESGEWIRSGGLELIITKIEKGGEKKDMQTFGSAITYARRYELASMIGIYQEDDDANEASGKIVSNHSKMNSGPIIKKEEDPRKDILVKMAEKKGWHLSMVGGLIKNRYKKSTASELSEEDFKNLCEEIENGPQGPQVEKC